MMIVGGPDRTEATLLAGEIPCPDCSAQLRPHGYTRTRTVRGLDHARLTVQLRRARCAGCGRTQVLLPVALAVHRADTLEAIRIALAAKAPGGGYRTIAAHMGRPLSTARRWFRRVPEAHTHWLYKQAKQRALRHDPDILVRPIQWPSLLGRSLNILAGSALSYAQRLDGGLPPWSPIGLFTRGKLLSSPLRT